MPTSTSSEQVIVTTQAFGFLLSKDSNQKMDRVKLVKLLWAADRYHLRHYGRTVSGVDYLAFQHGPIASIALAIAQQDDRYALTDDDIAFVGHFFTSDQKSTAMSKNPGIDHLSDTDIEALNFAWDKFGNMDTFELADDISHRYPEWARFSSYFENGGRAPRQIDMLDFFENPTDPRGDYFAADNDKLESARSIFVENQTVESLFGAH